MKLSVHLVALNGEKYIPYLFDSLRKQSFRDWKLYILDNASQDKTVEAIKRELNPAPEQVRYGAGNFSIQYELAENMENLGFAKGHNQIFKKTESEYVLLLNQDMYLMPDCLEKLVIFFDQHNEAGSISPRLMKWNFSLMESPTTPDPSSGRRGDIDDSFTNNIDSLGLEVFRNRRVVEQYAGRERAGKQALEVFGVSGALPLYRRSAINEVLLPGGQIFDESYHSYKEDVDLAYRLMQAGYKSYCVPDAAAYHGRSAAGSKELDDKSAVKNKIGQPQWVKYHSYKNHLMTIYKNEYWQNFILDLPWILWYEIKKFIYFLLFDRNALKGLKEVWVHRKELAINRKLIITSRKITWKEMRAWWK